MYRLIQIFRHLSQQKTKFFYNEENQDFRQTIDSVRARIAYNRADFL